MALIHSVYDTDAHFKIDPITRAIKNSSKGKNVLIQYDHNSERFTFEVPKLVDGHDMSVCTAVEVHFINIDSSDKTKSNAGVYPVDDLQISPEDENVVICSWLISQNATQYAGPLNFLLKFKCVDDSGKVVYRWHTAIFSGISVSNGMDNGEAVVEEYSDVLAQWSERIGAVEERLAFTNEGRTARYTVTSSGWKRVMVLLRTHSGIMNFGIVRANPNYMGQTAGIDFTGFVKYGRDTTTDKKPVLIQRYNNIFGENNALENPAIITKVRIGYPKQGADFPYSDGAVKDYARNPINCYLDMYVEFDPSTASSGVAHFGLNYAGLSNNHHCEVFMEETEAADTGIYGEELVYHTLELTTDFALNMPDDAMQVKSINVLNEANIKTANIENLPGYLAESMLGGGYGLQLNSKGKIAVTAATEGQIDSASAAYLVITPKNVKYAVEKYTADLLARIVALEETAKTITFSLFCDSSGHFHTFTAERGMTWKQYTENDDYTMQDCNGDLASFHLQGDGSIMCFTDGGDGGTLMSGSNVVMEADTIIPGAIYSAYYSA